MAILQQPPLIHDIAGFGMFLGASILVSNIPQMSSPQSGRSSRPSIGKPVTPNRSLGTTSGSMYVPSSSSPIRRPVRGKRKRYRKRTFKSSYFGLLIRAPGFSKFIK